MAKKRINLALQGGGAHGAFTWGVLDRLLQDDQIEIAAISGTSAGALNGAAVKAGLVEGGPDKARANLDALWQQVGSVRDTTFSAWMDPFLPSAAMMSNLIELSPGYHLAEAASRVLSPYSYGPFYKNPLTPVVEAFNYDMVCHQSGPAFYVCATNVRSGKIRVFDASEVTTEVILASACLPTMFQAVELLDTQTGKVEAFWDGGYTGNPALFPLFDPSLPNDVVIVNINPLYREDLPISAQDIQNRINEISFNSSLLRELRAIAFVKSLIAQGKVEQGAMKDVLVHMIADDALMGELSVATKLVPVPQIIAQLKDAGDKAARAFLEAHRGDLNHQSTVNLSETFG